MRCGNPSRATAGDVERIRAAFGAHPRSLIDLRSHEEVADDAAADRLLHRLATTVRHVPLGDRATVGRVLVRRANVSSVVRYLFRRFVLRDAEGAKGEMVAYMGGLVGLNELILKNEGKQLGAALKAIVSGEPPVLLYCTAGKDRTGLVTALALSAAGVPRDVVVDEYALSDEHKHVILERAMAGVLSGEESLEWSSAPAWVMRHTLAFVDREFGGVDAFLDSVGFSAVWRWRMRRKLLRRRGRGVGGDARADSESGDEWAMPALFPL